MTSAIVQRPFPVWSKFTSRPQDASGTARWRGWKILLGTMLILLTLAPPAYMGWVIATTGANNPSNDLIVTASVLDRVLDGTYTWSNIWRDTFLGGAHCLLLPFLIRLVVAICFEWNIYVELYVAFAFAVLKLIFLQRLLARGTPHWRQLCLWPVLSALVFSLSQINVFTFSDAGLSIEMTQLGVVFGLWALARYQGSWRGIVWACLGGVFASFSSGSGPLAWPVFFLALMLLRERRMVHYASMLAAAALGWLPYIWFKVIAPGAPIAGESGHDWRLAPVAMIQAIGFPFARDLDAGIAQSSGLVGLALGIAALILCWRQRRSLAGLRMVPVFMLGVYALMTMGLVTLFRGPNFGAWYTTLFLTYWLALVGIVYGLWEAGRQTASSWRGHLVPVIFLAVTAWLFVRSNLTYEDKVYYLSSRAPVSAASLRYYRTAPAEAEQYVFQWQPSSMSCVKALGKILERHHLSVFGSHQHWTLQGEFGFDTVHRIEAPEAPPIEWCEGLKRRPRPYHSYKHLNLLMPSSNEVRWTITLSRDVKQAVLDTAVAMSTSAGKQHGEGVVCELYVEDDRGARELLWTQPVEPGQHSWSPCSIHLDQFAGQSVSLCFCSRPLGDANPDWVVWRHPCIDLVLQR